MQTKMLMSKLWSENSLFRQVDIPPDPQQIATKGFSVVFIPTGYTDQQKKSLPKSDLRKWVKTGSFPRWPQPTFEITKTAITSSIILIET